MSAKTKINGLSYLPHFLSPEAGDALLTWVEAQAWDATLARRVQQYGAAYDYARRRVNKGESEPLPDTLQFLAQKVGQTGRFSPDHNPDHKIDQIIINDYQPGQGIAPHVDAPHAFGPVVAMLSLGAPVVMDFYKGDMRRNMVLEPLSLLVLSGAARAKWQHGIAKRKSDILNGERMARGRRVSLTFRSLLPT